MLYLTTTDTNIFSSLSGTKMFLLRCEQASPFILNVFCLLCLYLELTPAVAEESYKNIS